MTAAYQTYQVTLNQRETKSKPTVDCMASSQDRNAQQLQIDTSSQGSNSVKQQIPMDFEGLVKQPNIELVVKNSDTLTQFSTMAHLDLDYLAKVQKWIGKNKFECDEQMDDLQISIGDIFNFTLGKSTKSAAELVREELQELKREKVGLIRDFKLFQHYFFSFWKERARDSILSRDYLLESIVESPQNLYNVCDGIAFVEDDEFCGHRKQSYIGFRQPVAFLYHTGNSRSEENMLMKSTAGQRGNEEWFEVFISGKSYPHHLAQVCSRVTKKITVASSKIEDGEQLSQGASTAGVLDTPGQITFYLHRVDLTLCQGSRYTIHTPKIFT